MATAKASRYGWSSVIRGLNFRKFTNAVEIRRSNHDRLECNFIGTAETGMAAAPNNLGIGVLFECESTGNIIGGTGIGHGNLISDHASDGVQIFAVAARGFSRPASSKPIRAPRDHLATIGVAG